MRGALVLGSLGLAGCLATPPSGLADDPDAGVADGQDADPGGDRTLILTGLASRDPLSLDLRDELVLAARQANEPELLILFPGEAGLENVSALEVPLPFEPVDLTTSRWGAARGMAFALAPDGQLYGIDQDGVTVALPLAEDSEPITLPIQHIAELNIDGRRLTLADGEDFYATDPLGVGQPGEQPIEIYRLGGATDPVLVDSSYAGSETAAIGVVEDDHEIDVYPVTVPDDPQSAEDLVVAELAPDPLLRASWQLSATGLMVLIGIDPAGPGIWWHSTAMNGVGTAIGTALDGQFDALHDIVVTRLDDSVAELAVLAEQGGELRVVVFRNPAATPDTLPDPMVLPVDGLGRPVWMQAMDAVFDEGDPGQNEIVVYDQAGHLACVDLVVDELVSCGSLDLNDLVVKARGASTSGRPGW